MEPAEPLLSSGDLGQLRAFIAVAEALSFTRAAERLGVSASALSQMVRALEERVGVRLLNRTTRSVSLTDAGDQLFQRVRPAVRELAAALGQAQAQRETPAGIVRIHCFHSAAQGFLAPVLRPFHQSHPEVVLDITLDDEVVNVVASGYDAAIRIGEVIEKDMVAIKLGPDLRQLAVASPEYLARCGAPEHPRELLSHSCLSWRWPGHATPYRWEFWEDGKWFEVAVDGPLVTNSKELCVKAALDGLGIAFATEPLVAPHLATGRLVALLEPWSASFPGWYLCYPAQRQMAPALRVFIDAVRAHARNAEAGETP
jgi:DNA-binding transcriptional LysR family regulator